MRKEYILACIKDCLINVKLVNSLENLHLSSEDYYIELPETILSILQIKVTDDIFEKYLEQYKKVGDIDVISDVESVNNLVDEIYAYIIGLSQIE